jgi:hypothetical protein
MIKTAGAKRPGWIWLDFARGICDAGQNCLNFGVFPHNRLAFRLKRPVEQASDCVKQTPSFSKGRNNKKCC